MNREHIYDTVSAVMGLQESHLTDAVTSVIASSLLGDDPASVVLFDFDQIPVAGGTGTTTIITDILAVHAG